MWEKMLHHRPKVSMGDPLPSKETMANCQSNSYAALFFTVRAPKNPESWQSCVPAYFAS